MIKDVIFILIIVNRWHLAAFSDILKVFSLRVVCGMCETSRFIQQIKMFICPDNVKTIVVLFTYFGIRYFGRCLAQNSYLIDQKFIRDTSSFCFII